MPVKPLPDLPSVSQGTRTLVVPNDPETIELLLGALSLLLEPEVYLVIEGMLSVADTIAVFQGILSDFLDSEAGVAVPVGSIILFAGETPPANFLACNGATLSQTDYAELFAVIGSRYGTAPVGFFVLPDVRGRVVAGVGQGTGLTNRSLGDRFGTEFHQLATSELPNHDHALTGFAVGSSSPVQNSAALSSGVNTMTATRTGATGSNTPHPNTQPSIALNVLIRVKP